MMIEFQRGRYEKALAYSRTMKGIGDKLRVGSEGPFAHALEALCEYALSDTSDALEPALEALRNADAKYRLAYTLTRAAQIDCERGRFEDATRRATEALGYAELLRRATEAAMARGILACICRAEHRHDAAAEHEAAIAELEKSGLAGWVSAYLNQKAGQKRMLQA
jgi:tetratricopeptide (TPR) repeat protein